MAQPGRYPRIAWVLSPTNWMWFLCLFSTQGHIFGCENCTAALEGFCSSKLKQLLIAEDTCMFWICLFLDSLTFAWFFLSHDLECMCMQTAPQLFPVHPYPNLSNYAQTGNQTRVVSVGSKQSTIRLHRPWTLWILYT